MENEKRLLLEKSVLLKGQAHPHQKHQTMIIVNTEHATGVLLDWLVASACMSYRRKLEHMIPHIVD